MKLGRRVIQANHTAVAQQYAKSGCPSGLRGQIWKQILGVAVDDTVSIVADENPSFKLFKQEFVKINHESSSVLIICMFES